MPEQKQGVHQKRGGIPSILRLSGLGATNRPGWERQTVLVDDDESSLLRSKNRPPWERWIVLLEERGNVSLGTKDNHVWERQIVVFGNDESLCTGMTEFEFTSVPKKKWKEKLQTNSAKLMTLPPPSPHTPSIFAPALVYQGISSTFFVTLTYFLFYVEVILVTSEHWHQPPWETLVGLSFFPPKKVWQKSKTCTKTITESTNKNRKEKQKFHRRKTKKKSKKNENYYEKKIEKCSKIIE